MSSLRPSPGWSAPSGSADGGSAWYKAAASTDPAASPPLSNRRTIAAPLAPQARQPWIVSWLAASLRTGNSWLSPHDDRPHAVVWAACSPPQLAHSTASDESIVLDVS